LFGTDAAIGRLTIGVSRKPSLSVERGVVAVAKPARQRS
jgi:hypothetical protein